MCLAYHLTATLCNSCYMLISVFPVWHEGNTDPAARKTGLVWFWQPLSGNSLLQVMGRLGFIVCIHAFFAVHLIPRIGELYGININSSPQHLHV